MLMVFATHSAVATDYYTKAGSGPLTSTNTWGDNTDGTGNSPANFLGTHTWHFANRTTFNANLPTNSCNFAAAATMSIHSGVSFTISGTASFANQFAIDMAASSTLVISKSTNLEFNSLDPASTIIFNAAAYPLQVQSIYSSPGYIQYGNVVVNVSGLANGSFGDININGLLTISASRVFSISTNNLFLNGTAGSIAGTGSLSSTNNANIITTGGNGGNNGTITFASTGSSVAQFFIFYNTGTDRLVLGSDLSVENGGFLGVALGILDLNGNDVSVDATSDASFPAATTDGFITGNAASTMKFEGSFGAGTGNPDLLMNPAANSLSGIVMNTANTLRLGNALVIIDSLAIQTGTLDANSFLTLRSTDSKKARIGTMLAGAAISNNLNVETFIDGGLTGWMNMGGPGLTGPIFQQWDNWTSGNFVGIPMTCSNCVFPAAQGTFVSIQRWNEATSAYIPVDENTSLNPGLGYWVYVGDGQTNTNDLTVTSTGTYTHTSGTPPTIAVTAAGSGTAQGFNLIANPFTSAIDWDDVMAIVTNSIIANAVYAWSPQSNQYESYVSGVSTGGIGPVIPIGQGFYVDVLTVGGTLTFSESVKSQDLSQELARSVSNNRDYFRLRLMGQYGDGDNTVIRLSSNATSDYDARMDARKLFKSAGYSGTNNEWSKYTTISTKDKNGNDYSINSMPLLTKDVKVPVLVRAMYNGTFTIAATDIPVEIGTCLILYDKAENKYQDLRKGSYTFSIKDTTSAPRFELMMCQSESGPVTDVKESVINQHVFINQDRQGIYVNTRFETSTTAVISAYNLLGQELMNEVTVTGTDATTRLNLDAHGQAVIVRVTTGESTIVKKLILN
jgi:hypothetical protein